MNEVRVAAYHEAGHAVMAFHSRFHQQCGRVVVSDGGAGRIAIRIDKNKFWRSLPRRDPDRDIIEDLAEDRVKVLCAGLAGTEIARVKRIIGNFDPGDCGSDFDKANRTLAATGLESELTRLHHQARGKLQKEWWAVERVAGFLFSERRATARVVLEMIDDWYMQGGSA